MTLSEFNKNVLEKLLAKGIPNVKHVEDLPLSTRLILAIADCRVAIFPNEYKEYSTLMETLNEIDGAKETKRTPSKQELIVAASNLWQIDTKVLVEGIQRMLSA